MEARGILVSGLLLTFEDVEQISTAVLKGKKGN